MIKVREFQKDNDLVADGIIGPNTLKVFQEHLHLSREQLANLLGQLHHETGGFTQDTESLNYSPTGLIKTFSYYRHHKSEAWVDGRTIFQKANQPEIANKVYWDKNRSENYKLGNLNWGDGWKFRGRGSIMTTGFENYSLLSLYLKDYNVINTPDVVAKKYYWKSGTFFFEKNHLWKLSERVNDKNTDRITAVINKGTDSYTERRKQVKRYYDMLC